MKHQTPVTSLRKENVVAVIAVHDDYLEVTLWKEVKVCTVFEIVGEQFGRTLQFIKYRKAAKWAWDQIREQTGK